MLKSMLMMALVAALLVAMAGCNTMHGLGRDVEATGRALQDAAD